MDDPRSQRADRGGGGDADAAAADDDAAAGWHEAGRDGVRFTSGSGVPSFIARELTAGRHEAYDAEDGAPLAAPGFLSWNTLAVSDDTCCFCTCLPAQWPMSCFLHWAAGEIKCAISPLGRPRREPARRRRPTRDLRSLGISDDAVAERAAAAHHQHRRREQGS